MWGWLITFARYLWVWVQELRCSFSKSKEKDAKDCLKHLYKALSAFPNIFSTTGNQNPALNKVNKQKKQGCVWAKKMVPHPGSWLVSTFSPKLPDFMSTLPLAAATWAKGEQGNDHSCAAFAHQGMRTCFLHPSSSALLHPAKHPPLAQITPLHP